MKPSKSASKKTNARPAQHQEKQPGDEYKMKPQPEPFDAKRVKKFGESAPMKRAGQPDEVAPSYIFLARDDASYITGQVIHPNGETIVGS